jgi:hypothetical protein
MFCRNVLLKLLATGLYNNRGVWRSARLEAAISSKFSSYSNFSELREHQKGKRVRFFQKPI